MSPTFTMFTTRRWSITRRLTVSAITAARVESPHNQRRQKRPQPARGTCHRWRHKHNMRKLPPQTRSLGHLQITANHRSPLLRSQQNSAAPESYRPKQLERLIILPRIAPQLSRLRVITPQRSHLPPIVRQPARLKGQQFRTQGMRLLRLQKTTFLTRRLRPTRRIFRRIRSPRLQTLEMQKRIKIISNSNRSSTPSSRRSIRGSLSNRRDRKSV